MPELLGERLLFLIGAPRSGTTLLMRMLAGHPTIYARSEPHLLTPLAHLGYFHHVQQAPYDPFQSALAIRNLVADLPQGEVSYLRALRAYTHAIYGGLLHGRRERYFLDKTPAYALVLPFIRQLYPRAHYVVLTRHPFAIFASYARRFFDDDWQAAWRFNPLLERYLPAIAALLQKPPNSMVHVRYEDLVTDPVAHLGRVCARVGITPDPTLVNYQQTPFPTGGLGDPVTIHRHTRPTTAYLHSWTSAVAQHPDRQALLRQMIAWVSDEELTALGYPRDTLWDPLDHLGRTPQRKRLWNRYHLKRHLVLRVRKLLRRPSLQPGLKHLRFVLDVLTRD